METKMYIFSLDYSERMKEKVFIKDILKRYDSNALVGCGLFVNNNPYNPEMLLFASFEKGVDDFESFIKSNYPSKRRIFNYFIDDIFESFQSRGYNSATFIDEAEVDSIITDDPNFLFLFPSKQKMNSIWKTNLGFKKASRIFLSHSSKDNKIVDDIFNELQKSEIHAWYDKYGIEPGDSITEKLNEGLDRSDIGVICISKSFLNSPNGWTKNELNFFVQRRIRNSDKAFIIFNIDVPHEDLPPLVQDYKYINYKEADSIDVLIETLKKKLKLL